MPGIPGEWCSQMKIREPITQEEAEEFVLTAHPFHILWVIVWCWIKVAIAGVLLIFMYPINEGLQWLNKIVSRAADKENQ